MNLIEEDFQKTEEKNNKIIPRIILAMIILLVIIIALLIVYMFYIEESTMKVYVNGATNENVKQMLIINEDGSVYVPIKEIAEHLGYNSFYGDSSDKSEDKSKCYVQSIDKKEIANFTLDSNKVYKLDLTATTNNYEYIYSEEPVKADNEGILYATPEMIEKAFNVSFQYNKEENEIIIYTMPFLIEYYKNAILNYGYTQISEVFANQKTILEGIIVVQKEDDYAVINTKGQTILEAKYDNITYLPNVGDFLVEDEEKVGIISKNGERKIEILYDSIKLMDSDLKLYVVEQDEKYGVIDFSGNMKIHIENDEIGMDISSFDKNNIKSKYILADNLIPVRREKLWGLYDKEGKLVVDFKYDNLGYIASNVKNALNLLVIPDYNVVVASKDKKYTLLNSKGKELFDMIADAIYMKITGGEKSYYILANDKEFDAQELLEKNGISSNTNSTTHQTENNQLVNTTNNRNNSNVNNSSNN